MKPAELVQEVVAGLIAIVTVIGALLITAYQLVNKIPTTVPEWITLLIGAIVGAYFARAASQNGARQAGTAAAQVAVTAANLQASNGGQVPSVPAVPPAPNV